MKKIKLDLEDHGNEGDLQSLLRLHKVLRPIMPPRSQARFVQLKKWGIRDSKCNSFKMSSMIFFPKGKKAKHT